MKISLPDAVLIALAAMSALAAPAWLLWPPGTTAPRTARPLPARPSPALAFAEPERKIFVEQMTGAQGNGDAPELIGVAGRLPDGAVAMVRGTHGKTRSLSRGQRHEGWRLEAIAPDAALFERNGQRVRSALPPVDPVQ